MTTRFLANEELWQAIRQTVKKAKSVRAAFAYLGTKGAKKIGLRQGHRLVVDMSLKAVRQGATNPHEIKKLQRKGVKVFTRSSLHAKFLIADRKLIACSANLSVNSQNSLDEAGLITTDPHAAEKAKIFFDKLCNDPIRPKYLKQCIKEYRKPRFKALAELFEKPHRGTKRINEENLWFIGGIEFINWPRSEADKKSLSRLEHEAAQKRKTSRKTSITWIRFSSKHKPKFLDKLHEGEWAIRCIKEGKSRSVFAPSQIIEQKLFISRENKQRYWMLFMEEVNDSDDMPLHRFRRRVKNLIPNLDRASPRTRAINDPQVADTVKRFWTVNGKLRK